MLVRDRCSLGLVSPLGAESGKSQPPDQRSLWQLRAQTERPLAPPPEGGGVEWGEDNMSRTRWPRPPGPWTPEVLSLWGRV